MKSSVGRRLTRSQRLVLVTVAAWSLTVPFVAGAIEAAAFAAGQLRNPLIGPAIDPESRFEVVSRSRGCFSRRGESCSLLPLWCWSPLGAP